MAPEAAAANLRSAFAIMGKGVAKGRQPGEIDMRAIAPTTLAQPMKAPLPDAEAPPAAPTK